MEQAAPSSIRHHLAMPALALSMMLAALGTSIANVALPSIGLAFDAPFADVKWVVTAYLLALTVAVMAAGPLGDRFGLKPVLIAGLVMFLVASLLCGVAPDLPALIAARALQGGGAAFIMTLTVALVQDAVGQNRVGSAMGLLGTMSAAGTALGPSLGGVMVGFAGWHGPFFILLPVTGLTIMVAHFCLPAATPEQPGRGRRPRKQTLLTLGPALTANLLIASVMMATLVVMPFYLGSSQQLDVRSVGLVMAVGPAVAMLCGVPAGRLVDRFTARSATCAGLITMTFGCVGLALLPEIFGIPGYAIAICVLTPGYQLFLAGNNTEVMKQATAGQRGVFSGLLALSRNLGFVTGAAGLGAVFGLATGDPATPDAIAHAMQVTFLLGSGLILAALILHIRKGAP